MTPFLISTILSFLAFEFLCLAQITFRDNKITLNFGNRASQGVGKAVAVITVAIVLAALIISIVALYVLLSVNDLHPYPGSAAKISLFLTSPGIVQVFYGFVLGILLGAFVNAQLGREPNAPLQTRDKLSIAAIIFMMFLGLGGDGVFRSLGSKLEKISVGAAGVNFEASLRTSSGSESPGQGALSVGNKPPTFQRDVPQAFGYLGALPFIIERDRNYLELFKSWESTAANPEATTVLDNLKKAKEFATTITAPTNCLAAWQDKTADASAVIGHVTDFANTFRRLRTVGKEHAQGDAKDHTAQHIKRIARLFLDDSIKIARHVHSFTTEKEDSVCESLFNLLCRPSEKRASPDVHLTRDEEIGCLTSLESFLHQNSDSTARSTTPSPQSQLLGEIENGLNEFIMRRGAEERPYFAIGYASLIRWLGSGDGAAAVLESWLREKAELLKSAGSRPWRTADDWFKVRAQAMLAAHLEDWIRRQKSGASISLRNYHLDNLQDTMMELAQRLAKSEYFANILRGKSSDPFARPGDCVMMKDVQNKIEDSNKTEDSDKININPAGLYRNMFTSYLSMKLTRVQTSITHPDYETKFAETTNLDAERLLQMDISCVENPFSEAQEYHYRAADVFKAQILEAYARNAVAYTIARRKVEGDDARKTRLQLAAKAARTGLEIIESPAKSVVEGRSSKDYLRRIEPSEAVDTQEKLKRALRDITQGTLTPED